MTHSKEVCYSRAFARVEQQAEGGDWDFDDNAGRYLFPAHLLNSLALAIAHVGFLMWLFLSPHMNFKEAVQLDWACGSFFMFNFLANLLNTGAGAKECSSSRTPHDILLFVSILAMPGISIGVCNILCHRYLIEKAKAILKM
jgi:hypothetical protein